MIENMFDAIVNSLDRQIQNSTEENESDYTGENGLIFCGRCNTAKQCKIELFGKERIVACLCKCEAEKRKAERELQELRERQRRCEELRRMGFPDSEMHQWTFEADDKTNEKISNVARNYVENFKTMLESGKGLLLYGTVGTGKTFYSACIVNALIDKGYPCLMTNFSRLVNTISGMYEGKQDYIDGLNKFDLIVIDDLAAERDTEYMNEIVQTIIDSRYRSGLPTIITTNLTAEEIKNPADIRKQRTYSRLLEMCLPVEVKGADRRRAKLVNDYAEFNELLGL